MRRYSTLALLALLLALPATVEAKRAPWVTFYFGLERDERAARAAFWAVQAPSSPTYRAFLDRGQLAERFGAKPATVRELRRLAKPYGIAVAADPTRVFARLSGRVPAFERFLGAPIRRSFDNNDISVGFGIAPGRSIRLPAKVRPLVREVVASFGRSAKLGGSGSGSAGAGARAGAEVPASAGANPAAGPKPGNAGAWVGGCSKAEETGTYSFAQVRRAYGIEAIPAAGGSVAILNVGEGLGKGDLAANAACFGLPGLSTRTLLADGQKRPFGRGSFEPQEDLALVRGMAPGLASLTFTQTWEGPELWFLGAAGLLAAEGPLPDSFSISYGICEREVRGKRAARAARAGADLMDALLVRLGLAGVASFASAGDFGSTCNDRPFAGVAWPAASPFLTAVGGTRLVLDAANERVDEVVWNDLAWLSRNEGGGAGGGGRSAVSKRPPYQAALPFAGSTRLVPDLAAHASMLPGWPVVLAGNWVADGGTSASAPLLAAAFAALSASQRAAGRPPLGPVNSPLYARPGPATVFDVLAGNNGFLAQVAPLQAGPGFDLASGLGVPRFDLLASSLP